MNGNVTPYLNNITSEHSSQPNYTAMVAASCQPIADLVNSLKSVPGLYDVDLAVGSQLDIVGQWVGVSRYLNVAIPGVYFTLDDANLGFDQGVWRDSSNPATGLTALPDDYYRLAIYTRILNNHWNGSLQDAYALSQILFAPLGYQLFIADYCNLTMSLGIIGGAPTPLLQALFTQGLINVKPAGVRIDSYIFPSNTGPMFALDINNVDFAGFDNGSWATIVTN